MTPDNRNRSVLMLVNTDVYDDPRVINEGLSLVRAGYNVTVIGAVRHATASLPSRAEYQGLHIILVPMVTTHSPLQLLRAGWQVLRSRLDAVTDKPESTFSNSVSLLFFNLWCLRLGFRHPAEVIHCHDFSPLPAAWLLTRLRRIRLIYDSHESAPDFYGGHKGRLIGWLERRLLPQADAVITVGERLALALRQRGANQVTVIGNWKPISDFNLDPVKTQVERTRLGITAGSLVISYIGGLEHYRLLLPLLEAVYRLPEVTLLIAGRGELESAVVKAASETENIRWLGWLEADQVPLYTALSDVIYCCIPDYFFQADYIVPNKLFEAFAGGKALIACRGVGEMSQILAQFPAALLLDDVTPETLQAAFQQLQHPKKLNELQNAALQAREQYNWSAAEARLLVLYDSLLSQ